MKGLSVHSKQRGFTLIEVGIALAIGLVIILGVVQAVQNSQRKAATFEVVNQVQTIMAAAFDYKIVNGNYTEIDTDALKNLGHDIADNYVIDDVNPTSFTITPPDTLEDEVKKSMKKRMEGDFDIDDAYVMTYPKS
jgi:prepilin-type N-terminal cleavage/methylation domain-containing protein